MLSKYIINAWNNEIEDQVSRIDSALNYTKIEYYKNDFITYSVEEDVSDLLHKEKRKREELIDYNNKLLKWIDDNMKSPVPDLDLSITTGNNDIFKENINNILQGKCI